MRSVRDTSIQNAAFWFRMLPVRVVNESRGKILAERAQKATRVLDRLRGLLGREDLEAGEGLLIDPCTSIHTFFMRFAIDVIFVDEADRVVSIYESLPPWRITRIHTKAKSVLELPAGSLNDTGTAPGDILMFEEG